MPRPPLLPSRLDPVPCVSTEVQSKTDLRTNPLVEGTDGVETEEEVRDPGARQCEETHPPLVGDPRGRSGRRVTELQGLGPDTRVGVETEKDL